MKRLLLIIALVLLGVLALVEQSERWTYSLWRALDRVPEAEALAHAGAPEPIAHAAGVVEGHVYTNSREALERALRDGYRFVELDLRKTIGGDYFAAHRYREFYEMTGGATFTFLPPTRKRVEESLLHGSLHPLFLEDACRILREKDAWLVTDKALDAGIRYPALNTHRIAEAQKEGIKILVVTPETYAKAEERDAFLRAGGSLLVASSERCSEFKALFGRPGTWVYTDRCSPKRVEK